MEAKIVLTWQQRSKKYKQSYFGALKQLYGDADQDNKISIINKPNLKPKVERIPLPKESYLQSKLIEWARSKGLLLISIPNHGKRSLWQGQKERAMGLTAGVSDLFLSTPNHRYHGYWIEMKSPGKKPTEKQIDWMKKVQNQGYKAEWFDDWEKARDSIEFYLSGVDNVS